MVDRESQDSRGQPLVDYRVDEIVDDKSTTEMVDCGSHILETVDASDSLCLTTSHAH